MFDTFSEDEECNCQGPGTGCVHCYIPEPEERPDQSEEAQKASSWYTKPFYTRNCGTKIIKAKWLETVTPNASLFVTKKGCIWIPIAMIESLTKTDKGYKIEVYTSFETQYVDNINHRYFKNKKVKK